MSESIWSAVDNFQFDQHYGCDSAEADALIESEILKDATSLLTCMQFSL